MDPGWFELQVCCVSAPRKKPSRSFRPGCWELPCKAPVRPSGTWPAQNPWGAFELRAASFVGEAGSKRRCVPRWFCCLEVRPVKPSLAFKQRGRDSFEKMEFPTLFSSPNQRLGEPKFISTPENPSSGGFSAIVGELADSGGA